MISDELFAECLVILQDDSILEEDQAERISELIASKTSFEGTALENEVLDVLWRHRTKTSPASSPPIRHNHTIIRRASPAPWQFARVSTPTPSLGGTPPLGSGFPASLRGSPFPSPRPSPRLAYTSPLIPHSPTLNNYEPALPQDMAPSAESYGDFDDDTVSWLIGDDSAMQYGQQATDNMSPHDMLRSVLGEARSDQEIDQALEACSYDLGATLTMLMEQQQHYQYHHGNGYLGAESMGTVIGKSMSPTPEKLRPITPRNGVVCRFFLSTGQCLRADCRFSHDLGTTICKYWLMGNCLAGDTCIFSHDPTMSVSRMTLDANSRTSTPPPATFHDHSAFPALGGENNWNHNSNGSTHLLPTFRPSRPSSRQQRYREHDHGQNNQPSQPEPPVNIIPVDDDAAFPSLGSAAKSSTPSKKRDRARKTEIPTGPASLAEVVRMSPAASPGRRWATAAGSPPMAKKTTRPSAAHIPPPQQIPWLDTGSAINRLYIKHRREALNHGVLRAKYLQFASAAWQRNDSKAAKEHSRKANNENLAMVKAHKEAAKVIYEERNKEDGKEQELFCDLHGLLPDEGVRYLEDILVEHQTSTKPVYAIVGTSHHSKGGKDKLSRAIKAFLDEWRYAYREFSASGDRGNHGGILGIDPSSYDKSLAKNGGKEKAKVIPEKEKEKEKEKGDGVTTGGSPEAAPAVGGSPKEIPKGPSAARKK